jgi:hypothetical protein
MGAITASDVTEVTSWQVSVPGQTLYHRIVDIALDGNGGTADDIPASTLGFAKILWAQSLGLVGASADLHCVPVVVEDDQAGILTINLEDSTDASRSDPANPPVAGDLRVLIVGIRA